MASVNADNIPAVRDRLQRAMEEAMEKKKVKKKLVSQQSTENIDWPKLRPNLSSDFPAQITEMNIEPCPVISQECIIIGDLLSCFLGVNGQFITADPLNDPFGQRTFSIDIGIDSRIAGLAQKCLTMASDYSMISRFIQENRKLSVGRVNQALAAAMDEVIDNYINYVTELENQHLKSQLNLHTMWYLIQAVNHPLHIVANIANTLAINKTKGADTLNYLVEYTTNHIDLSKDTEVCVFLTECAAAPIMVSVQKWIFNGVIYDPFDEFMIVGNPRVQLSKERFPDEYWSKRYQIKKSCTPIFLRSVESTILNAGKYLNVIKECLEADWNVRLATEENLKYTFKGTSFLDAIGRAYKHSSKYLLSLMIDEYSIFERIKSVKRYFLLQQGDFVVQLLDNCEEELCQPIANCIPTRLATLVEMSVRLPSTSDDEFRDDIMMTLKSYDLTHQVKKILNILTEDEDDFERLSCLTGLQAFTLSVRCMWPVSLVFNFTVISAYQMLFRHLFYCKYVERLLSGVWQLDKSVRALPFSKSKEFSKAFALRHKMIYFVQNIEYYMMEEAIEPNWVDFLQLAKSVESIDSLLEVHWTFLKKCMQDCLLTNPELLILFQKIMSTCQEFCEFVTYLGSLADVTNHKIYSERVDQLESAFQGQLLSFLHKIEEISSSDTSNKLWNILLRENFNYYFSDMLQNMNDMSLSTTTDNNEELKTGTKQNV